MAVCVSALALAGCGTASEPQSTAGVRDMYRSIGLDASSGEFNDICRSYMAQQLRAEFEPTMKNCLTTSFERWAEKIRVPGLGASTRIVVSGHEALVYRTATAKPPKPQEPQKPEEPEKPEKAIYLAGQWRLAEVPAAIVPHRAATR
jgi:hypothetical protein